MPPFNLTRRSVIAGTGLAATMALIGPPVRSEKDDFRVIRATERGYQGIAPEPFLHVRRGEELKVRLVNELKVETSIHWHGVRVPNAMDGTALVQVPIAPGASFDYRFTPRDAGTFWYHPPLRTAANRTLHGLLIVNADFGQSNNFDGDLSVVIDNAADKLTANGIAVPDIPLWPDNRYRLRLANVGDDAVALRIEGHRMTVIGIDGQPAEPFIARDSRITLWPGNRADVLIDALMKPNSVASIFAQTTGAEVPFARLVYGDGVISSGATMPPGYTGEAVKPLAPNPLPERMDFRGALRTELAVDAASTETPAKPLFAAKRGRTVMLALVNKSDAPVVTHLHGHAVRLLDRLDDGWKPFWLDTILCVPRETTRIAFVADNPGKWLIQSRTVRTERTSLAWFEVT